MSSRQRAIRAHRPRRRRSVRPILENLENRLVLSSMSTSIVLNLSSGFALLAMVVHLFVDA